MSAKYMGKQSKTCNVYLSNILIHNQLVSNSQYRIY